MPDVTRFRTYSPQGGPVTSVRLTPPPAPGADPEADMSADRGEVWVAFPLPFVIERRAGAAGTTIRVDGFAPVDVREPPLEVLGRVFGVTIPAEVPDGEPGGEGAS